MSEIERRWVIKREIARGLEVIECTLGATADEYQIVRCKQCGAKYKWYYRKFPKKKVIILEEPRKALEWAAGCPTCLGFYLAAKEG